LEGPLASDESVLSVRDLRIEFPDDEGRWFPVVDGVGFDLRRGETLGFVGESGSGKTMTALSLLGLVPEPGRIARGEIRLKGESLRGLGTREWSKIRGRDISMVFQDALSGLNPVRTIGSVLVETIRRHQDVTRGEAREQALEVLAAVGIPEPAERIGVHPHQLSGGLRQRVMIALAIVNKPSVIIADEPTTALDATIQAQILDLLADLAQDSALLLITHDLGVAASMCDRVAVIYAGRLAEVGSVDSILGDPRHPYTAGLLEAVPTFRPERRPLAPIEGAPPSPANVAVGCPFAPRCPRALARCPDDRPVLESLEGRLVACWNPHDR
jgi:oligopeptide/dipeptide ABC transporter ATP-binding protein